MEPRRLTEDGRKLRKLTIRRRRNEVERSEVDKVDTIYARGGCGRRGRSANGPNVRSDTRERGWGRGGAWRGDWCITGGFVNTHSVNQMGSYMSRLF